ncbi:MAG: adenylate/guanylate cyclase domain-containing protein [Gaiellaceae bacterium]
MQTPDVSYARSGDVAIAYQTVGAGSVDVLFARGFAGDLLSVWEQPLLTRFLEDLAIFARVTVVDKRGTGLSDGVGEVPMLETRMDDLRAVMDAIGSEQAILWTAQEGARLATLFAATYPERTAGLVLFDPSAKGRLTPDYPWALTDEEWRSWLTEVREGWGRTDFLERQLAEWAPSKQEDPQFRSWFIAHMRRGLSPGSALAFFRMVMESDVSEVLPSVRVPTVVLSSEAERGPGRYFAERIPGARLVELPPSLRSIYHWVDDDASEIAMRETRKLAAVEAPVARGDRVLATVLFTDIVGSTERASQLGDRAWRHLLERHHSVVRRRITQFRGDEIDTAGDGFFASFDGPGRAIECARTLVADVRALGLELRVGLHTGECERHDGKLTGIAVPVGARVANAAARVRCSSRAP